MNLEYTLTGAETAPPPIELKEESNRSIFLSHDNMNKLFQRAYRIYKQANPRGLLPLDYFARIVPYFAEKWFDANRLNDSYPLGITSQDDLIEHISSKFMKEHELKFALNGNAPFTRTKPYTQDASGNYRFTTPEFMLAEDIRSLDLHDDMNKGVYADSSKYRRGNKIPYWQKTGCGSQKIMMTDRFDLDGFATRRAEEASLVQSNRGYDMSAIINGSKTLRTKVAERRPMQGAGLW